MNFYKKILSGVAALTAFIFSTPTANAQTEANATLNIHLKPVFEISISETSTPIVELTYATAGDYQNGVSVSLANHLKINSTSGFQIKAKAEGEGGNSTGFNTTGSTESIEFNSLTLTAAAGENAVAGATYNSITNLGFNYSDVLVSSTNNGGLDKTINVEYKGAGNGDYINMYKGDGSTTTTYKGTVVYTIMAN